MGGSDSEGEQEEELNMEHDFERSEGSGASHTYPTSAGNIRKGGFVMIKGRPTKCVEVSTSKTGKHGHAKAHIVAIDIFTNKKMEELCPCSHNIDVPNVKRTDFQLLDFSDDERVTILLDNGDTKDDIKVGDDEIIRGIRKMMDEDKDLMVTILEACGEEAVIAVKEASK